MTTPSGFSATKLLLISALCVFASGCARDRVYAGSPAIEAIDGDTLPAPTRADVAAGERPYLMGAFDILTIDVFGIDELKQRKVQVDASGRISFPLIGGVQAAGLTPVELAREIESRLRGEFIRDPQVTINLDETVSQVITVDGQVNRPGLYPVVGRMTLIRAVARAGGTGEFAKLEDVVIQRNVDGQKYIALYNLQAIRQGNYGDPEVFAHDIVIVGDSPSRRLFRDVISASGLIVGPIVAILR
ncbi:polysaccharide biosynthesis/export family protein [Altererythrobacter sp. ZODW24]|uniref:polysaccharide biosynthesis/export family protein n=1 Tax=Altererythrobacter sp. ZODW24 TaxID=2185142 RepID=UPI000DF78B12|nr:polysaccharide biosynthesis/export family protein [Altererythrobacter sp. ZODW24]